MNPRRADRIGVILIGTGICLLVLVGCVIVYGRLEVWAQARPRVLVSNQIVWPQVPPMTPLPSPTPIPTSTPTPTPTPTPGAPVQIEIPSLSVERAIVPVGMVAGSQGLEWDAEKLFATANRRDLVGHLEGSARPGEIGNVVLIGHNYNRGIYNWIGVFQAIHRLQSQDTIRIVNENNELFIYRVERVEQVSWSRYSSQPLAHIDYLSPTRDETLTLVTCGGANLAPFPSRVYVIAKRHME